MRLLVANKDNYSPEHVIPPKRKREEKGSGWVSIHPSNLSLVATSDEEID